VESDATEGDEVAASVGRLDAALTLERGDGCWEVEADAAYEGFNGMFGGWTAAAAIGSVCRTADEGQAPSAATVNFLKPVVPGSTVRIRTRRLGGGRSASHWSVEVQPADADDVLAAAMIVLTSRRPTDGHLQAPKPDVPGPEGLEEFHPPDPLGERSSIRPVEGHPPFGRMDTRSLTWLRELSGRKVDRLQLAFLADQCAPRSFFWSDGPRASATLSMTVYFHATDAELSAVGDDFVLHQAIGTRGADSTADMRVRLWSRSGVLLATSEQLCWYR
jgi:acyl-CoA thioesterase